MSDCPICFDVISDTQNVVITECRHKFHATCLIRSTQSSGYRCPNCRGSLLATPGPVGPTGASYSVTMNHGTGATASYSYLDVSMNVIRGPTGQNRAPITYHNDSSDDESGVNGG